MADELKNAPAGRSSFGRTLQAVAWAFFGVRKSSDHQQQLHRLNPLHLVVAGLIGAVVFVGLLLGVVRWVAG